MALSPLCIPGLCPALVPQLGAASRSSPGSPADVTNSCQAVLRAARCEIQEGTEVTANPAACAVPWCRWTMAPWLPSTTEGVSRGAKGSCLHLLRTSRRTQRAFPCSCHGLSNSHRCPRAEQGAPVPHQCHVPLTHLLTPPVPHVPSPHRDPPTPRPGAAPPPELRTPRVPFKPEPHSAVPART